MQRFRELLIRTIELMMKQKRAILSLSVVVVFITTYLLILPAFTLEKQKAAEQGGIDVPGIESTSGDYVSDDDVSASEDPYDQSDEVTASGSEDTDAEGDDAEETNGAGDADTDPTEVSDQDTSEEYTDPLAYDGEYFRVSVIDKENVLPENTEIRVEEIIEEEDEESYNQYRDDSIQALNDDENTPDVADLKFAHFYDIKLYTDGEVIDAPDDAVEVRIEYDDEISGSMNIEDPDKLHVIHFAENKRTGEVEPEILDSKNVEINTDRRDNLTDTTFEAQSFSVYALVYTIDIQGNVLTDSGDKYRVTISYDDDAQIPEDAELVVREITDDEDKYSAICENADELLQETNSEMTKPVLLDISIVSNGEEIEPAEGSDVNVSITVDNSSLEGQFTQDDSPILINDHPVSEADGKIDQKIQVIHQNQNGDVEVVETRDKIGDNETTSSFTTDSFSDWLLFLDETVDSITIGVNDSLTLRPYSKWAWKRVDEEELYKGYEWQVPQNSGIISFTRSDKEDDQLHEIYSYYHGQATGTGSFDLQLTYNGTVVHTIHVTVVNDVDDTPPEITQTEDITVNLFDYDINPTDPAKSGVLDARGNTASTYTGNSNDTYNQTVNTYSDLKFLGWGANNSSNTWYRINDYTNDKPNQGILKPMLEGGYPQLGPTAEGYGRNDPSLEYLFDTDSFNNDVRAYPNVNGLFQKDTEGYYYYNSNSNYAYYETDQSKNPDNKITLYEHTYSQWTTGSAGANAKPIGFFPFHKYDSYLKEGNVGMNYNTNLNHHFGMSMTVDFEIPDDGLDEHGNPITFEFSGDDDMWVFIDDVLVLDVGGIHQPVTGTINFSSDKVSVHSVADTTITQMFENAGSDVPWQIGDGKPHTLKVFYLERGGCDSNLSLRFNTPKRFGKGKLSLVKRERNTTSPLPGAKFRIWDNAECKGEPIGEYVSDEDGAIDFGEFVLDSKTDTFYMKEVESPDGYIRDTGVYKIKPRLNDQGEAVRDSSGDYIILDVISEDNTVLTTLDNGAVVFPNDKRGKISIPAEKKWAGDPDEDAVVILNVKRYKLIDKTKGFMIIKELSGEPEGYSFDASYTITYPDGTTEVISYSDFNEGVYSLEDAEPGDYIIEETINSSSPAGYTMSHTPQPQRIEVTLDEDGTALAEFETAFTRDTGTLYIKQNINVNNGSQSDIDYSGVRYAVLDSDGKKVTSVSYADAAQGIGIVLPTGDYTVKAVSVPVTKSPLRLDTQNTVYSNTTVNGVVRENVGISNDQTSNVTFNTVYTKMNSASNSTWRIADRYDNTVFKTGNVDFPAGTKVQMSFRVPLGTVYDDFVITYNNQNLTGFKSNAQNNTVEYLVEFVVQNNSNLNFGINANKNINNWANNIRNNMTGPVFEVVENAYLAPLNSAPSLNSPDRVAAIRESLRLEESNTAKHPDAPAGMKYIKDNEWSEEVILSNSNGWIDETTLKDLPACDEEGNKYYYYVDSVEEQGLADGTVCTIDLQDGKQLLIGEDLNQNGSLSVTNNETTSISARKVWAGGSPSDHPGSVRFKIYQVGYYIENNEHRLYREGWYEDTEYTITGSEITTVDGLPKTELKEVEIEGHTVSRTIHYEYQVVEIPVDGYHAEYSIEGDTYTITNTPMDEPEHLTELELQKDWTDHEGNDASSRHASDKIEFKLEQKAIKATDVVPVTVIYGAVGQQPAQVQMFVTSGTVLEFTFRKGTTILPHLLTFNGAGINTVLGGWGETFTQGNVRINGPTTITASLTWGRLLEADRWGDTVENLGTGYQWTHTVRATSGTLYQDYDSMYAALHGEDEESTEIFTYRMDRSSAPSSGLDTEPFTVSNTGDWKAKFTDLPQFQKVGDNYYIYTYEISEFKIITGEGDDETEESVGATTETGFNGETTNYYVKWVENPEGTWTITNQEKPAHAEFIKKWLNASGQTEAWPDDMKIEVTIKGDSDTSHISYVYEIDKNKAIDGTQIDPKSPAGGPKLKVVSTTDNNYRFILEDLDRYDQHGNVYVYTVTETQSPDGYQEPHYILANGTEAGPGSTATDNGGTIENAITTYELPEAGGIGTNIFYILGSIMLLGCAIVLIARKRILDR